MKPGWAEACEGVIDAVFGGRSEPPRPSNYTVPRVHAPGELTGALDTACNVTRFRVPNALINPNLGAVTCPDCLRLLKGCRR